MENLSVYMCTTEIQVAYVRAARFPTAFNTFEEKQQDSKRSSQKRTIELEDQRTIVQLFQL